MSDKNPERSILGRTIVISLFGTVCLLVSIAVFGSIVSELYGQPPPPAQPAGLTRAQRNWCIRSVVALRDELESQVTLELHHPRTEGEPMARWQLWHGPWQDKLSSARARCSGAGNATLDGAFNTLGELHGGYVAAVERIIMTRADAGGRLSNVLRNLRQQH